MKRGNIHMKYLGAALFMLLALSSETLAQFPERKMPLKSGPPSPVPQVTIKPQPDAALRIASANTNWAMGESGIEIFILVENVGDRVIRAFATRRDNTGLPGRAGCFLNNLLPGKVLRRGQKDGKSTWQHYTRDAPLPVIWVDFIEFSDNSTWGADECHCADRLAGEREGARAMRALLLKILSDAGPEGIVKFIKDSEEEIRAARAAGNYVNAEQLVLIETPPDHSLVFEEGFRFGASTMVGRAKVANEEWGSAAEIEAALRRPYDASEVK
jgi:hypothetical protein